MGHEVPMWARWHMSLDVKVAWICECLPGNSVSRAQDHESQHTISSTEFLPRRKTSGSVRTPHNRGAVAGRAYERRPASKGRCMATQRPALEAFRDDEHVRTCGSDGKAYSSASQQ